MVPLQVTPRNIRTSRNSHWYAFTTRLCKRNPSLSAFFQIAQVADALSYLHTKSIIHGDIKGSNILINDNLQASLTDFGLARILHESGFTTVTTHVTWQFTAPELLVTAKDEPIPVTEASDVWAFAMTVVEVLTGCLPFPNIKNQIYLFLSVTQGRHPDRQDCQKNRRRYLGGVGTMLEH